MFCKSGGFAHGPRPCTVSHGTSVEFPGGLRRWDVSSGNIQVVVAWTSAAHGDATGVHQRFIKGRWEIHWTTE